MVQWTDKMKNKQSLFDLGSVYSTSARQVGPSKQLKQIIQNQNHYVELTGAQWDTGLHKYS